LRKNFLGSGNAFTGFLTPYNLLSKHPGRWVRGVIACMALLVVVLSLSSQHMPALKNGMG